MVHEGLGFVTKVPVLLSFLPRFYRSPSQTTPFEIKDAMSILAMNDDTPDDVTHLQAIDHLHPLPYACEN